MIDPELREATVSATDSILRQFAGLWLLVFGGMAIVEAAIRHHTGHAILFGLLAAAVGPVGLLRPRLVRLVFTLAMALAVPLGWVVSHLLLAVLYYALFTPMALVFRLIKRDALARRRRETETYWTVKEQPSDPASYLRPS